MRVTVPVCAAGTIALSIWLMGALVGPGPTALPTVSPPVRDGSPSTGRHEPYDTSARHGPTGTFVLTGRVVDAATGDPIPGADVNASSDDHGGFGSTRSDQRGNWTLTRLAGGSYHVTVRKAEYQVRYSGLPLIALTDARPKSVLNVALARGSALSGRITNSTGRPTVGVDVAVLRVRRGSGGTTFQFEGNMTESDDSGAFRLSGLGDGEYVLAANLLGPAPPGTVTTFYPGATTAAEAERFELHEGTVRAGLAFSMQSMATVSVRGRILSSTGEPVAAAVSVERRDGVLPSGGLGRFMQGGGQFTLSDLVPGRYRILAMISPDAGRHEAAVVDVTVGRSDINDLVLRPVPLATIRGRVVTEGVDPVSLDWLQLGAMPVDAGESSSSATAPVRQDRTFEIQTYHAPARIAAFHPMRGWQIKTVRWKGHNVDNGVLSFQPSETIDDVEVVLARQTSILEGVVHDAAGGTCVLVLKQTPGGKAAFVTSSPLRDGEFRTLPVMSGHYRVVATSQPVTPAAVEALWNMATPVTLADDQTVTLTLNVVR